MKNIIFFLTNSVCRLIFVGFFCASAIASTGYKLPFQNGKSVFVTVGNNEYPHSSVAKEYYSWDLRATDRSSLSIVASRAGVVVYLKADGQEVITPAGYDCVTYKRPYAGSANYVVLQHSDGKQSVYLHLAENSTKVSMGQWVSQGEIIGTIGNTGWSCGTHLHFQVQSVGTTWFSTSVPITFDDVLVSNGIPQSGNSYISNNIFSLPPEFHGAGSLISPSLTCFGCNKDTDAVHANGKAGLLLFQWYYSTSYCDHIDIAVDGMSYAKPVKIRTGAWDNRAADKNYSAMLPVSVEPASADAQYPWNVTAVKLDAFSSKAKVTATCKTSLKVGTKTAEVNRNAKGIDLENGWIWQGNGSLISTIQAAGFGVTKDVVNLTHAKGAAFFQWQKSANCKNLWITAGLPGNYKLRMRGWDVAPPNPNASNPPPEIMSNDSFYLSPNQATVLNYAELAKTFSGDYYLLSVYSDIYMPATTVNPVNVSCSAF